jgi:putative hydrolase of HD superfamily
MPHVRKSLLQFVFSGSFMKRWNDKLRPMELLEVDKQAHKMIVAWLLYQINAEGLDERERLDLGATIVEGGLFEYFYRLVITDIKPPIFYQIKANADHYRRLTDWVLEQLEPRVQPLGQDFWDRLRAYLSRNQPTDLGSRILMAAHLYASNWEFNLIKGVNPHDEEFQEIDESFRDGLAELSDIKGVDELRRGIHGTLGSFAHLCGQLRFQKRWSQTPRIPETSVIGHMYIVACYAYFFSLALDACPARRQNNFFAGLFHDLPELLTRDIISPVKKSVQDIGDLIKEYEGKELDRRVLGPLTGAGHGGIATRLSYFLGLDVGSEFYATVVEGGTARRVDSAELRERYNHDAYDPKDGEMLKVCDMLAAFIEAYTALRNGISSDQLQQALWRMRAAYQHVSVEGLHIGALLADFD